MGCRAATAAGSSWGGRGEVRLRSEQRGDRRGRSHALEQCRQLLGAGRLQRQQLRGEPAGGGDQVEGRRQRLRRRRGRLPLSRAAAAAGGRGSSSRCAKQLVDLLSWELGSRGRS